MKSAACPFAQQSRNEEKDSLLENTSSLTSKALEQAKSNCPAFRNSTANGKVTCPFRDAHNAEEFRQKMLSVPKNHWMGKNINGTIDHGSVPSVASVSSDTMSTGSRADFHMSEQAEDESKNDVSTQFRLVLEHMHVVSKSLRDIDTGSENTQKGRDSSETTNDFTQTLFSGECPFKTYYHSKEENNQKIFNSFGDAMEDFSFVATIAQLASKFHGDGDGQFLENESPKEESSQPQPKRMLLSTALKKGTKSSHRAAENVHFVKNFIKGKIQRELYATLIANLYFIYYALEELLDKHAPSTFPTLHKPHQLRRTETLERDAQYFYGTDWKSKIKPLPATADYINRLHSVAQNDPLLLLSHAYTRYLGDLSGGRVLQRVARKALKLEKKTCEDGKTLSGLDFYDFLNIKNPKAFKNEYRLALDDLNNLDEKHVSKLVGEANVAFVLNMRVFEELDVLSGVENASVRPLDEALAFFNVATESKNDPHKSMNAADSDKCPFLVQKAKEKTGKSSGLTSSKIAGENEKKRCPWPFVFAHDPMQGMRDYQTWIVIALFFSWVHHQMISQ